MYGGWPWPRGPAPSWVHSARVLCHRSLPQARGGNTPQLYWPGPLYSPLRFLAPGPGPQWEAVLEQAYPLLLQSCYTALHIRLCNSTQFGPVPLLFKQRQSRVSNTAVVWTRIASQTPSKYRELVAISSRMDWLFLNIKADSKEFSSTIDKVASSAHI